MPVVCWGVRIFLVLFQLLSINVKTIHVWVFTIKVLLERISTRCLIMSACSERFFYLCSLTTPPQACSRDRARKRVDFNLLWNWCQCRMLEHEQPFKGASCASRRGRLLPLFFLSPREYWNRQLDLSPDSSDLRPMSSQPPRTIYMQSWPRSVPTLAATAGTHHQKCGTLVDLTRMPMTPLLRGLNAQMVREVVWSVPSANTNHQNRGSTVIM